ncbi:hypothetical protein PPERSA_00800 [Pseudocohnilembus persalinus]|uniref:P-loop containing nucleoside triphosphate hydrolase n=1 Tax=Pseudocohnilembus persalinus TaxID=266149 RepID=A0A0V0QFV2_PSEPJ|nr:hypothetical protein PPERSA_00800 [Pseudocohnilembus persalinus]|eukprot:KRX01052.1 hypothetical protein PPERSA_00800 [Pseudocohnilembus persalinus]
MMLYKVQIQTSIMQLLESIFTNLIDKLFNMFCPLITNKLVLQQIKQIIHIIKYSINIILYYLNQADLVVIDEAASIPVDTIKKLIGPYLVFMASTVNGYEGTGRSLSLKLIQKLKQNQRSNDKQQQQQHGHRVLKELSLQDPIRYAPNDPIEKWLNNLLLLDASEAVPLRQGMPHPNDCELYMVNRDTLFSSKKATEKFLFNLMSLFISSHYKNSPNDLQMLSDAPAHAIFVLLNSITVNNPEASTGLPDILCAVQVSLEGKINKQTISQQSDRGFKPQGDLIPWIISEQFQDKEFPQLSGARIVRIATHPSATKMGYGTKAIEQLKNFFQGKLVDLGENVEELEQFNISKYSSTSDEKIKMKPILKKLTEIQPPKLDYLGVSFGLSRPLFHFWQKGQFSPLYLRQTKNEITSEHTCIMLNKLQEQNDEDQNTWIKQFYSDFNKRFLNLLAFQFRDLNLNQALAILNFNQGSNNQEMGEQEQENNQQQAISEQNQNSIHSKENLELFISPYDLKRLEAYCRNMVDYHNIIDLLPIVSRLFFEGKIPKIHLSYRQAAILLGLGLQHKEISQIADEINLPTSQCLALFIKAMKRFFNNFKQIYEIEIQNKQNNNKNKDHKLIPVKNTIGEEVQDEGEKFIEELQNKNLQGEKVNKKRKGKYNFEMDDIDIQEDIKLDQNGTIQVKRDSKVARLQKENGEKNPKKQAKKANQNFQKKPQFGQNKKVKKN